MESKRLEERNIKEYIKNMKLLMVDGVITMTSLEISDITQKSHMNVIRDIKDEIAKLEGSDPEYLRDSSGREIFEQTTYIDKRNRDQPMYILTVPGIYQIMARYDAVIRRLIIIKLELLSEIAKFGQRDLSEERNLDSLHEIMRPFIQFISEVYFNFSNNKSLYDEDREHYEEEYREWSKRVNNEEDFLEWWESLKRHQDDTGITERVLNRRP